VGAAPTPPPPNVEALPEPVAGGKVLQVRELMALHSKNKSCHSCHGVMDPLGFALESFDATGRWRDKDRLAQTPIDTSAELPDGTPVNGPNQLREALLSNQGQFVQTLVHKLMTYGVGRPMEWHDKPTVRRIVQQTAAEEHRFHALVLAVVNSPQFRMKRLPADAPLTARQSASH
jgi:hypothetical protein